MFKDREAHKRIDGLAERCKKLEDQLVLYAGDFLQRQIDDLRNAVGLEYSCTPATLEVCKLTKKVKK